MFEEVKALLIELADASDTHIRRRIYARHNPTVGGYSWETEASFLASVVVRPTGDIRVVPPVDFSKMEDSQVITSCTFIQMLASQRMPPLDPSTRRRPANEAEIAMLVKYAKALPFPRK